MSHLICLDKSPQEVDPFTLTLSELEIEITTLYGHINAATYRFLVLLEAFNAQDGWGEWGIKSCAHWLNWKCGIALGAAREKVRVAEALPTLPLTSAAFRSGTVSYSKVRAMTRIATPENEDYLVMIAQHGTASHVEKLVREFRRSEAWEAERHGAELRHQARMLEHYHDEDGMFVLHAKLPPEQGAVVLKAIQAAIASIAEEVREQKKLQDEREEAAKEAERAEKLQVAQAEQTENDAERTQAEPSHWNEQAPTHLFFKPELSTEDVPAGTSSRLNTRADILESHERSMGLRVGDTFNQRSADGLVRLAETLLATGVRASSSAERYQVVVHVDAATLERRHTTDPSQCTLEDGPWLATETARRITCDASLVKLTEDSKGTPLDIGRKTRSIPPSLRRALKARDQGCRFPGCTQTRFVDGHHIHHWAAGGETNLDNLVQLCRHHHRLVHEGGFDVARRPDHALRFTRPDGQTIEPVPSPYPEGGSSEILMQLNQDHAIDITAETAVTLWDGVQMDYDMAIGGLIPKPGGACGNAPVSRET